MSSSSETSPAPDSTNSSPSPPPPDLGSSSTPPASPSPTQTPPSSGSETSPSPPPPSSDASTPPASSPPPPSDVSSSPPPPSDSSSDSSPPPPPSDSTGSGSSVSPPPPPSPPPSDSTGSGSSASPPPPPYPTKSPPYKALSPPPPHGQNSTTSTSSTSSTSSSSTANMPLVIGVTVGAGVLIIALVAICITCVCRKKRQRRDDMDYYMGSQKVSDYFPSSVHNQQPSWHGGSAEPGMKMHAPPGSSWPGPLPPQPMMSSGDMSSGYSGTHRHHPPLPPPSPGLVLGFNSGMFSYEELAAATGGFSQENLIGQGGFGYVHQGVLQNGKEVAVKSLKAGSGQGEREFQAEVEIISRVHHRHLVSLVGYCISGGQRMLVYEFIPNKTLEYHLYGSGLVVMDWPTRLRIATGSAKGLAYLHEDCHPKIIHRDIKAANILIDNNFEAMVADFGLAKLSSDNYTHVSTRVMGTFGYLAPEYASSGKLTEKSDVFSFGVMLLEIITGRRPVDLTNVMEDSLVDWARPILTKAIEDGEYIELVDPRLENNYNRNELARMVACASAAIRHSAKKRPKMSQIVRALEGDVSLDDLNEGMKLGQSPAVTSGSSDYDTGSYNADMKRFRQVALSSQDFGSSEYGTSSGGSREMGRTPNKF
ncbi:hypothetical protein MLD38_028648 [Melastoma candidum]|uniref:Uncharacterized protein n=1 Tax=Melastoma candidum TaxID=119954 RepID=A0ACB9N273_9MYRT|nr:hypothetical protein MLD38_028648 [Melastoma candidum]